MRGAEVRGFVVVLIVGATIFGLLLALDDYGDDDEVASATTAPPSTTTSSSTTTIPDPAEPVLELCRLTEDAATQYAELVEGPGLIPPEQVLADFYAAAADLDLGPITAEYAAAARFWRDYVAVGLPYRFDPERIFVEGTDDEYLRWRSLVTTPALGVGPTNANLSFLCGLSLPTPADYDVDELDELEEELFDERQDFRGED